MYDITLLYGTPEEVMFEVDDIPIMVRANEQGIEFVQVGEEIVYPEKHDYPVVCYSE